MRWLRTHRTPILTITVVAALIELLAFIGLTSIAIDVEPGTIIPLWIQAWWKFAVLVHYPALRIFDYAEPGMAYLVAAVGYLDSLVLTFLIAFAVRTGRTAAKTVISNIG